MKLIQVVTVPETRLDEILHDRFPEFVHRPRLFDGDWHAIIAPDTITVGSSILAISRWEEGQALDRQIITELQIQHAAEVMTLEGLRLIAKGIREMTQSADEGVPNMLGPVYASMLNTAGLLGDIGHGSGGGAEFVEWLEERGVPRRDFDHGPGFPRRKAS